MAEGSSAGAAFFAAALGAAIAVGGSVFVVYQVTEPRRTQFETKLAAIETKLNKTSAAIDTKLDDTTAAIGSRLDRTITESKKSDTGPSDVLKASALDGVKATLAQVDGRVDKLTASVASLERAISAGAQASNDSASHEKKLDTAFVKIDGEVSELKGALAAQRQTLDEIAKSTAAAAAAKSNEKPLSAADKDKPAQDDRELIVVYVPQAGAGEQAGNVTPPPLSVRFDRIGAVDPKGQTDAIAANLKTIIKGKHGCTISVAGYADTLGGDTLNLDISRQRAEAVAAKLRSAFAGQDVKIEKVGWGERHLNVWTPDGKGEKANRRVDISVDCKG